MIKAVRGTRDLLPPDTALWNFVDEIARDVFRAYNFQEIRTPIFEDTQLFARGVGEETDIVSKEMYRLQEGESLEWRLIRGWLEAHPEATARATPQGIGTGLGLFRPDLTVNRGHQTVALKEKSVPTVRDFKQLSVYRQLVCGDTQQNGFGCVVVFPHSTAVPSRTQAEAVNHGVELEMVHD